MESFDRFIAVIGLVTYLTRRVREAQIYLDPGTASIILQVVIGAIVGALATVKLYWHKFKNLFSKKKSGNNNKPSESREQSDDD